MALLKQRSRLLAAADDRFVAFDDRDSPFEFGKPPPQIVLHPLTRVLHRSRVDRVKPADHHEADLDQRLGVHGRLSGEETRFSERLAGFATPDRDSRSPFRKGRR
ncbi:MAG: hypothetical protein DWQ34_14405 [Planctomycetota bacterium]|nr:MAG: hypothetical protein DWQ34_14405 [Planctomycetota bacterium]REJ94954.1 MAG: hypothetical protein DWQ29_02360 [Planctomycetota bacterium]REK19998.1 MAG: hypothetical protein DWQ41_27145 [Planctomycetota bacterium]REK27565.1 MAG: hypothetical protein DWQ45_26165 [Planctomycetota bacterium]